MPPLLGLSSMATAALLAEVAPAWDGEVAFTSVGGVEAARRVRAGEAADVLVLADGAMAALEREGHLRPGSRRGIAVSAMAMAVRGGEPLPADGADGLEWALLRARRIGYSTGPSGDHLLRVLVERQLRDRLGDRLVQAPPGVPVGRLLVAGQIDLAFQQWSELAGLPGLSVAAVPPPYGLDTLFAAGIPRVATAPDAAERLIRFLASDATAAAKLRHGLRPV